MRQLLNLCVCMQYVCTYVRTYTYVCIGSGLSLGVPVLVFLSILRKLLSNGAAPNYHAKCFIMEAFVPPLYFCHRDRLFDINQFVQVKKKRSLICNSKERKSIIIQIQDNKRDARLYSKFDIFIFQTKNEENDNPRVFTNSWINIRVAALTQTSTSSIKSVTCTK